MAADQHSRKCVLLIDDDFSTRELLSVILAADGYRVCLARNGADALERFRHCAERPQVILLDLRMPVMDGCAFCQHRQKNADLAAIPVIVLSGLPDAAEQAALVGAAACFQKPIDPIVLLSKLRQLCADPQSVSSLT
jgi:CheY-like chemotaxis protein